MDFPIGILLMVVGAVAFVGGIAYLAWVSSASTKHMMTENTRADIGRNTSTGTIVTFVGIVVFALGGFAAVTDIQEGASTIRMDRATLT